MLEPTYSQLAAQMLDKIEPDRAQRDLWNAICDVIDLVCDHPDSAQARREAVRLPSGATLWQVRVRTVTDDWVLLWHPDGPDAVIDYVGPALA